MMNVLTKLAGWVLDYSWAGPGVAFVLGAIIGSFLNVCIYRLPVGESIFWPPSRCGHCGQKIRWYDNIPLVSYWVLRGRCRRCGARFSMRYFWIELLTATLFALAFWWIVQRDGYGFVTQSGGQLFSREEIQALEGWDTEQRLRALQERVTLRLIGVWLYNMVLAAMLIVATFTDIDTMTIPLPLTIVGTVLGCVAGAWAAWPWPMAPEMPRLSPWEMELVQYGGLASTATILPVPLGAQLWPVWYPLPSWVPAGRWWTGLVNAVVGAAFGTGLMHLIRALFSWAFRREALGLGDADLMMLIGAFLGWQGVLVALGASVFLALGYGIFLLITARGHELPFGPFLAGGALLTMGTAHWVMRPLQAVFFDLPLLLILAAVFTILSVFLGMAIRLVTLILSAR
ncbi:MAG: prepilin peptidase [Gemmatales bacterium]|nr:prepilin peptidase [Gemmatales bacterium]MDW7994317.1 prepilin peptidase [Gemmatales bacterium]